MRGRTPVSCTPGPPAGWRRPPHGPAVLARGWCAARHPSRLVPAAANAWCAPALARRSPRPNLQVDRHDSSVPPPALRAPRPPRRCAARSQTTVSPRGLGGGDPLREAAAAGPGSRFPLTGLYARGIRNHGILLLLLDLRTPAPAPPFLAGGAVPVSNPRHIDQVLAGWLEGAVYPQHQSVE